MFRRLLPLCLALAFVAAPAAFAAEREGKSAIETALAEAEKWVIAEDWPHALEAGNRLRALCVKTNGEDHADTALADLFLAEVRDHLGAPALAEAHLRRALAIQEKVLPPDSPELITTLTRLGAALKNQRRLVEAASLLQRALSLQEKLGGEDDPATATAATNLARVQRLARDFAAAVPLLERAAAIERRALGSTAPETLDGLRELAQAQELASDLPAAEATVAEVVVGAEARFGASSAELSTALLEWGRLAEAQSHFAAAEPRYRRAVAVSIDQPTHAASLAALGACLLNLGRPAEALPFLQEALEARQRLAGPDAVETGECCRQLARAERDRRNFDASRRWFDRALAIFEKASGPNAPATIAVLAELGDLQWRRGDFADSAAIQEKRLQRAEAAFGKDSEEAAQAWHALAVAHESAQHWPKAIEAATRSLALTEQQRGPDDPRAIAELQLLSRIGASAGQPDAALASFARFASWFAQHPDADKRNRAGFLRAHAIALVAAGRNSEAAPVFLASRGVHEIAFGADAPEALRSIADLWTYYDQTQQPADALKVARELAARTARAQGDDAPATAEVNERLGQLCLTLGDRDEALTAFRRAIDAWQRRFGAGSAEHLAALGRIAAWFEDTRDFPRAVALRAERLAAMQREFAPDSAEVAAACGEVALAQFRAHDFAAARELYRRQFELVSKREGGPNAGALAVVARLGDVERAAGDAAAALRERARLAEGCARLYGREHREYGRAQLLLGEARLAVRDEAGALAALQEARRVLAAFPPDSTSARVAAGLARVALRRGAIADAKRATGDAVKSAGGADEAAAEAFDALAEEWDRRGAAAMSGAVWSAALAMQSRAAGDQDEHTIALLERVAISRLRLGRPGAVALLSRAVPAEVTVHGAATPLALRLHGWLGLAQVDAGQLAEARETAAILRDAQTDSADADAVGAVCEWITLRSTPDELAGDAAIISLAERMGQRWRWLEPVTTLVARSAATARAALVQAPPFPQAAAHPP